MCTDLHSLIQSLLVPSPGGIGILNKVIHGEAPHGGTNTHRQYAHFYQNGTPFSYLKDMPKLYNFLQLPRFSGLLVFMISCPKGASFYVSFLPKFGTLLATISSTLCRYVNLPYTKMTIFPTLKYTASLKRHHFPAGNPRIAHYKEIPVPGPISKLKSRRSSSGQRYTKQ